MQVNLSHLEPNDFVRHKLTGELFRVCVVLRGIQAVVADESGYTHLMYVKELEFVPISEKSDKNP